MPSSPSIPTNPARPVAPLKLGAEIVNDVSALQWDIDMAKTCAELGCGVVLMHTRGRPTEWRKLPPESDIASLVAHDLANRAQIALDSGVERERIVLDPGFGFGKNFEENYPLLAQFDKLQRLEFPLLAGTSRKSFIGRTVGKRRGGERRSARRATLRLAGRYGGQHSARSAHRPRARRQTRRSKLPPSPTRCWSAERTFHTPRSI